MYCCNYQSTLLDKFCTEEFLVALYRTALSTLIPFCTVDCPEEVKIDAWARYRLNVSYLFPCVV